MKYTRKTAGYTLVDYTTNSEITKEVTITPVLDKVHWYRKKKNWLPTNDNLTFYFSNTRNYGWKANWCLRPEHWRYRNVVMKLDEEILCNKTTFFLGPYDKSNWEVDNKEYLVVRERNQDENSEQHKTLGESIGYNAFRHILRGR